MARKRMVTRTIIGTEANVLVVNLTEQTTSEQVFYVDGTYKDEAKLLKAVQTLCDENEKAVTIISSQPTETLFGMDERTFIQNSLKLDPETRKPINTED